MVHQVLQRFGFQFSSPQPTPLSTSHSLSAPPLDESVEPSGPYPELVGCLMYLMTCTRPDLAHPLSLLARYVAPGRHRKVHWDAAKRVLRYLCSTALYDAVVARYSSPTTAALSRLMLPYLFPDLATFATVADLVAHLRTSDARYRAALPTEFLPTNSPPMYITLYYLVTRLPDSLSSVRDHFLSLCPTELTVDLLEERLAAAEKSILAVGASRGDRRTPFFEGRSALCLPLVGDAAMARAREARVVEGAVEEAVEEVEVVVGVVLGVGASVAAVEAVEAVAEAVEAAAAVVEVAEEVVLVAVQPCSVEALVAASVSSSCAPVRPRLFSSFFSDAVELPRWHDLLLQNVPIFDLDFDAILAAMYALADITEGDCYLRVPPDLGTVAAALGASAAPALGASASAAPGAGTSPLSGPCTPSHLTLVLCALSLETAPRSRRSVGLLRSPLLTPQGA
ncbi:unnamed protein product [Closterium sp. NIES-54]